MNLTNFVLNSLEDGTFRVGTNRDEFHNGILDASLVTENFEIPSEIEGKIITQLGNFSLSNLPFKRVQLPNTIEIIRDNAISYCTNLEYINIPYTCKYIGYRSIHCYVAETDQSSKGRLVVYFDPNSQIQYLERYSICRKQYIDVFYWGRNSPSYNTDPFYKSKSDKITIHSPYLDKFAGEMTIHIFTCKDGKSTVSIASLLYFITTDK